MKAGADERLRSMSLVSGFTQPLPMMPALDGFTDHAPYLGKISRMSPYSAIIVFGDDAVVTPAMTRALAYGLDVVPDEVTHGGHFLASVGFTQLPLVYDRLHAFMLSGE